MFFKKARKEPIRAGKITSLMLSKEIYEDETQYMLCIPRDAAQKENFYLWNYIQRDIVCSVLEGYITYIYSPVEEHAKLLRGLCGMDYHSMTLADGTSLFWYVKQDFYLVTSLIENYWEMWECAAPLGTPYYVSFGAYDIEPKEKELKCIVQKDRLQGYLVKVVPVGDNDGLTFSIDESRFSEKELISRIRGVLERYNVSLRLIGCINERLQNGEER